MERGFLDLPDIRLAYVDFGGDGPGLLLLHGLMGRATTWADTARWLREHYHVVGLDQRGHGLSDKPDNAYSRDHFVNDAARAIERLGLAPTVIIGHSMGTLNGWVLAARRPDLVRGLVIEDMGAGMKHKHSQRAWRRWFATWPLPFPSLAEARCFFGNGNPAYADFFLESMTEGPDGYRPLFSFEHMLQAREEWVRNDYWTELEAVQCPALVVRGENGDLRAQEAREMARRMRNGRFAEVAGARHLVHYDQPEGWRAVVEPFVLELLEQSG